MNLLRRVWAATVWAEGGVAEEDLRFRGIFRWVLPLTDTFFLIFGLAGWQAGVLSVQEQASVTWQGYWSLGIAVFSFLALVGISFPRLWPLELFAKGPLIGLVSVYIFVLGARALENPLVAATAFVVAILILLPIWRVNDLGVTAWQKIRARQKARREKH